MKNNTQHLPVMTPLHDNIRYYPYYQFFRNCYFWGPAFFLYFTSVLTLSQTLWLESVYYIWVAVIEVPSGYLSDRFGRKKVLVFSSVFLSAAYLCFFFGRSFPVFGLAQILLGTGFAFASGTDAAFHYESLYALKRDSEYGAREARALQFSLTAGALGAVGGGALAVFGLKWIYAASFLASMASLGVMLKMTEPAPVAGAQASLQATVAGVIKKSWTRRFRFFTLFSLTMTVLLSFPYEFYQPYLGKVAGAMGMALHTTPFFTGLHLAATMLIASWFTRFGKGIRHRCRVRMMLMATALFQLLIIYAMAVMIHPAVVVLLLIRSCSKAISMPLINAELAPLLAQSERSTYMSLQSLAGRVSYGIILFILPLGSSLFSDRFHGTLVLAAIIGSVLIILVRMTPFYRDSSQHCCSDHTLHPHHC